MKPFTITLLLAGAVLLSQPMSAQVAVERTAPVPPGAAPLRLTSAEYEDRVHGAWLGQIIGTLVGWQFEGGVSSSRLVRADRFPRTYEFAPVDDDYYYELVLLRAFEKFGIGMTLDQLGQQWKENSAGSWGSSNESRLQLAKGVPGSQAGHPRYNRFWWTIGPQFSGDTYGLLAPGDPNLAGELARKYGHINGYAEGADGGVFVAGMVSLAFREQDARKIVRGASRLIHPSSPYRQCIDMVIAMAEKGATPEKVFRAVEDRWRLEYPAMNNAVANGGLVAASVWFGEGDYLKSVNLAIQAADFSDADCNAANAGAVIGAMKGVRALPPGLVEQLHDRISGGRMGPVDLTPPVEERISDIARRIVEVGRKLMAARGIAVSDAEVVVPAAAVTTQAAEVFRLSDFAALWNPGWTLDRAGFGGQCGGSYLDSDALITFPRDEARGALLRRTLKMGANTTLEVEVAADAAGAWRVDAYANNMHLFERIVEGGDWQRVQIDLSAHASKEVEIRLFQRRAPRRLPSCAHWRNLRLR